MTWILRPPKGYIRESKHGSPVLYLQLIPAGSNAVVVVEDVHTEKGRLGVPSHIGSYLTYHPSSVPNHIVGPNRSSVGAWEESVADPSPAAGPDVDMALSFADFLRRSGSVVVAEDDGVVDSADTPLLLATLPGPVPLVLGGFLVPFSPDSLSLESLKRGH